MARDRGWHLRHLKRLAKNKRLREAHLKKGYSKVNSPKPLQTPETVLSWFTRLKLWLSRTIQKWHIKK